MTRNLALVSVIGVVIVAHACATPPVTTTTTPTPKPAGDPSVAAAPTEGERWTGTFSAMNNRSADVGMRGAVSVHGNVTLTRGSTPEWTRVVLTFTGYQVSTLGFNIVRSRCGITGDLVLPTNAFPLMSVGSGSTAQVTTELHFPLPAAAEQISVNVYRADRVVSQGTLGPEGIVGCSNLRYLP